MKVAVALTIGLNAATSRTASPASESLAPSHITVASTCRVAAEHSALQAGKGFPGIVHGWQPSGQ